MIAEVSECKYCDSPQVIKYGKYKETQYYRCKACGRRFASGDTIPKMQTPTAQIASALNMYYEGMSLAEIRRNLMQQEDNPISRISAYNWVERFTDLAVREAEKYHPKVGNVWIADETYVRVDQRTKGNVVTENPYSKSKKAKWIVFWDIIDADTRFLLASHITTTRGTQDAKALMEKAARRAGKLPRAVVTDKLASYLDGIELAYGANTKHRQGGPFNVENNTNLIERFHGTIKERTKVMRGLRTPATAKRFLDGWLVHYNFFRPHMSLNDATPAQAAGIQFPFRNWKEVVEQPYEVTARIPIPAPLPIKLRKRVKRRPHRTERSVPVMLQVVRRR